MICRCRPTARVVAVYWNLIRNAHVHYCINVHHSTSKVVVCFVSPSDVSKRPHIQQRPHRRGTHASRPLHGHLGWRLACVERRLADKSNGGEIVEDTLDVKAMRDFEQGDRVADTKLLVDAVSWTFWAILYAHFKPVYGCATLGTHCWLTVVDDTYDGWYGSLV